MKKSERQKRLALVIFAHLFKLNGISFKTRFKLKHNRKTFKKYLMSIGFCRDTADKACHLVGLIGGELSYEDIFWYISREAITK